MTTWIMNWALNNLFCLFFFLILNLIFIFCTGLKTQNHHLRIILFVQSKIYQRWLCGRRSECRITESVLGFNESMNQVDFLLLFKLFVLNVLKLLKLQFNSIFILLGYIWYSQIHTMWIIRRHPKSTVYRRRWIETINELFSLRTFIIIVTQVY